MQTEQTEKRYLPLETLAEKLGFDQGHEKLLRVSPLYAKVTLAIIPPLRNSIDFIYSCHHRCEGEDVPKKKSEVTIDQADDETTHEIDVALPMGEEGALSSFLNMLTTALLYSSSEPLTAFRNIILDRQKQSKIKVKDEGEEFGEKDKENMFILASPSKSTLDASNGQYQQSSGMNPKQNAPGYEGTRNFGCERTEVSENEPKECTKVHLTVSGTDWSQHFSQTALSKHEMTPWQKSVYKKLNFVSQKQHSLFKYKTQLQEDDPDFKNLPRLIAAKLQSIFNIQDEEEFLGVFQSWLVRDTLLLGNVYLTSKSLCYYSLLPGALNNPSSIDSSQDTKLHEGALGIKLGHYGDSFYNLVATHQFWAILTSESLCIYTSATELFFPVKVVDLRDAIHCEILADSTYVPSPRTELNEPKSPKTLSIVLFLELESEISSLAEEPEEPTENSQAGVWFKIYCAKKTHKFYTKDAFSARHWCNAITKVIFILKNANSKREVLLKIPLENILEFKKNYILVEDEEDVAIDNDTPVTFTIEYDARNQDFSQQSAEKFEENEQSSSPKFIHFLLFGDGIRMQEILMTYLKIAKSHGQEIRNKKVLQHSTILSTLFPEEEKGVSLVDKIAAFNEALLTQDERERYIPKSGGSDSFFTKKRKAWKFDTVYNPATRENLSVEHSEEVEERQVPENNGINWHFPRPFSIMTLKSLNLHISTEKKSVSEIKLHYENSTRGCGMSDSGQEFNRPNLKRGEIDSNLNPEKTKNAVISSKGTQRKQKFKSLAGKKDETSIIDENERSVGKKIKKNVDLQVFHSGVFPDTGVDVFASYNAFLKRKIPVYGKLYLGTEKLYFRSLLPGVSTKMILPLRTIENLEKITSSVIKAPCTKILLHGSEPLILEFASQKARNDFQETTLRKILSLNIKSKGLNKANEASEETKQNDASASSPDSAEVIDLQYKEIARKKVREARLRLLEDRIYVASGVAIPIILAEDPIFFTEVRCSVSYKFTLLTIGSRGDVQPYIALGKSLLAEGHEVTIATHLEFREWILSHGLNFKEIAGNPAELMRLMVEHGAMSVGFLKEASSKFRGWVAELLATSWEACKDTDVLIESPSAMGGLHIAEALDIPYMRAFLMPWTRTKAYPHAFIVPDQKKGGPYNILTHLLFETVFWKGISAQINKWRTESLNLKRTNLLKMQQTRIPFLYNISPEVFPPAVDFPNWVSVTGYWFLNEGSDSYKPPEDLDLFIKKARADKKKIVYVGFGSIVVSNSANLTKAIVDAVLTLGVRCILNKGWSDRLHLDKSMIQVELPEEIYNSEQVPHDWLFPRIDAAVHHGGSGTTGASLRCGLPMVIKPFFGDQFFYASRIEELGVGIALRKLDTKSLTNALTQITTDMDYRKKAEVISRAMKHEHGTLMAIADIYSNLAYSKSLIDNIRFNVDLRPTNGDDSGYTTPVRGITRSENCVKSGQEEFKIDDVTLD